jgi:hypothetical protein
VRHGESADLATLPCARLLIETEMDPAVYPRFVDVSGDLPNLA